MLPVCKLQKFALVLVWPKYYLFMRMERNFDYDLFEERESFLNSYSAISVQQHSPNATK